MSNATHNQATHSLTLIQQMDMSKDEIEKFHGGYLTDLLKAIKKGTVPSHEQFHELVGLGPVAHLTHNETFTINKCDNPDDPHEFLKTRKGLYIWDSFDELILKHVKRLKSLSVATMASFELAKASNDAEIQAELPENYIFEDVNEFCAMLITMLILQWGGKSDKLLNNVHSNIFYVRIGSEVLAVFVRWFSDAAGWDVRASRLGGVGWGAGSRAFSATADTK